MTLLRKQVLNFGGFYLAKGQLHLKIDYTYKYSNKICPKTCKRTT